MGHQKCLTSNLTHRSLKKEQIRKKSTINNFRKGLLSAAAPSRVFLSNHGESFPCYWLLSSAAVNSAPSSRLYPWSQAKSQHQHALRLPSSFLLSLLRSHQTHTDRIMATPQASTNYKEAFSLFDKRGTGRVQLESLGDLLRACGQNPTLAEIRDLEKSAGGDCTLKSTLRHIEIH